MANVNNNNHGQHVLLQPAMNPQDLASMPWTTLDQGVRVPVDINIDQRPHGEIHLPAMENFNPRVIGNGQSTYIARDHESVLMIMRVDTYLRLRAARPFRRLPYDPVTHPGNLVDHPETPINHPGNAVIGIPSNSATASPNALAAASPSLPELSEDAGSNLSTAGPSTPAPALAGIQGIPNAATRLSTQGVQINVIIRTVQVPSIAPALAAAIIPSRKGQSDWQCYSEEDSVSTFVKPGFIKDAITGKMRKRTCIDDARRYRRQKYRFRWDTIMKKPREERGCIEGYKDGDSDFDFSEWEEEKEKRK